jgi:hypothetical protein
MCYFKKGDNTMDKVRHLTRRNEKDFFDDAVEGEVFTYSSVFMVRHIKEMGRESGFVIEYCDPTTTEYRKHGSQTCRILPSTREIRLVNGIGEVGMRIKNGEKLDMFQILAIMVKHVGEDIKAVKLSNRRKPDEL